MIGMIYILCLLLASATVFTKPGYHQIRDGRYGINFKTQWRIKKAFRLLMKPERTLIKIKSAILRLRILAGIEHPDVTRVVLIMAPILLFSMLVAITGEQAFHAGTILFPIFGSAIQPKEILGTGIVEASEFGSDMSAIQDAIDYMRTNNKPTLYVGPGTWVGGATDQLEFDGNTSDWYGIQFIGAGISNTILNFSAYTVGDECIHFTQSGTGVNRCWYVLVESMTLIGSNTSGHGFFFDYTWGLVMNEVRATGFIDNGKNAFYLVGCYRSNLHELLAESGYTGYFLQACNTIEVSGCFAYKMSNMAIFFTGLGMTIADCSIEHNDIQGIGVNNTAPIIKNCYFEGNLNRDIYIDGSDNVSGDYDIATKCSGAQIIGNWHDGQKSGVVGYTDYGIQVANADNARIEGNSFLNHDIASIQVGAPTSPGGSFHTLICHDIVTTNNWTGDRWTNGPTQWGFADTILVDITNRALRTIVNEHGFSNRISDAGFFTITPNHTPSQVYNNDADGVCPGDVVHLDTSIDTGNAVNMSATADSESLGIVYDGVVDDLGANANVAQADVEVDDIWAWHLREDQWVKLIDDNGEEYIQIDTVDWNTDTITMKTNLVNNYTLVANARILKSFENGDYFNVITSGPVNFLHVDGTTDISVSDYITNFSTDGVAYRGWDNFRAQALEAYTSNNSNGLIKAMVIPIKRAIPISSNFVMIDGGGTESDTGWIINVAGEFALGFADIPNGVNSCIGIRVTAYSEAVVAQQMQIQLTVQGGLPGQAFNTTNDSTANLQSVQSNFNGTDLIEWLKTTGAGVTDIVGGYRIKIQVNHENAGGGDTSTAARLWTFSIICV